MALHRSLSLKNTSEIGADLVMSAPNHPTTPSGVHKPNHDSTRSNFVSLSSSLPPSLPPFSRLPLSSQSSVQSEGHAQDLVIQRLELALESASSFLNSPSADTPADPPSHPYANIGENAKESSHPYANIDIHSGVNLSSSNSPMNTSRESLVPGQRSEAKSSNSSLNRKHMIKNTGSKEEVRNPSDLYDGGRDETRHSSSRTSARGLQRSAPDWGDSASQIASQNRRPRESAEVRDAGQGQVDLDFVQTLGDRLVSATRGRRSSSPPYRRLVGREDVSSSVGRSSAEQECGKDLPEEDLGQKGMVLGDFDLLHEEIV